MRTGWMILLPVCALLAACPGGAGGGSGGGGGVVKGNGDGDQGEGETADRAGARGRAAAREGGAEARLRALVDDVVKLSRTGGCKKFGARLTAWTEQHREQVGELIAELKQSANAELSVALDAHVSQAQVVVVEAAADCAATDADAWPAWERFEAMIVQASAP